MLSALTLVQYMVTVLNGTEIPFKVSLIQTSWEILRIISLDSIKNASVCAAPQEY